MSSELSAVWRDSRIYGLGSLLNRLAGLLLIPVVLHVLPAEDWGTYMLILAVTGFLAVPAVAAIDTMVRLYFENEDKRRRRRVVGTLFGLYALMACGLAGLAVPLASLLGQLLLGHQERFLVILLGLFVMVFDLLLGIVLDYLRILKRPVLFVAATLSRSLGQFGLTILLVVAFDLGLLGVVLGSLIATAAVALSGAAWSLRRVGLAFDRAILREIAALGIPLVPAWLSKSAYPLVERQVLNLLAGPAAVGIFAFGSRLSEQLGVLMQGPFAEVWGVRLMEVGQDSEKAQAFHRIFLYFLIVLTAAALGLALYAPELVRLLSASAFWPAMALVPVLALAQIGAAMNYHFEVCLIQAKQTRALAVVNVVGLAAAAGLVTFLTARYGLLGAAAGALAAQLIRLGASIWFVARCSGYVRLFPWREGLLLFVLGTGAYLLALALGGQAVTLTLFVLKALVFAGFLAAVFLSPALTREERGAILGFCRLRLAALAGSSR